MKLCIAEPLSAFVFHALATMVSPPKKRLSLKSSQQFASHPRNCAQAPVMVFITYCSCPFPVSTGTFKMSMFCFGKGKSCQPKFEPYDPMEAVVAFFIFSVKATLGLSLED